MEPLEPPDPVEPTQQARSAFRRPESVLIVIHTAAAVWHHFIKRDRVAARMVDGAAG